MNRSRLFLRALHKHQSRHNNSSVQQPIQLFSSYYRRHRGQHVQQWFPSSSSSSSFWVAAAGTCIFFQLYDHRYNATHNNSTLAEQQRQPKSLEEEDEDDNDKKHGQQQQQPHKDDSHAGEPWYRRYPTQALERIRHPTIRRSYASDNDMDNNSAKPPAPPKSNDMFYGQCLQRQLWKPPVPYPAWDYDWDGKMLEGWSDLETLSTAQGLSQSSRTGTTRHILLVRHGQYDEGPYDDRKRVLTALGRRQAQLTGKRMASLIEHVGADKFKAIYTSDLLRAKQTAWIMAKSMPDSIPIKTPDPELNEALPAPMIPLRPDIPGAAEEIDEQMDRMDRAFHKHFYRADPPPALLRALEQWNEFRRQRQLSGQTSSSSSSSSPPPPPLSPESEYAISSSGTISMAQRVVVPPPNTTNRTSGNSSSSGSNPQPPPLLPFLSSLPPPKHEFDVIVCHGNVIRYFVCRALQIPPEAWLRQSVFNCSITYIMIKPNGYVSCRMIGDIGHLGYKETTFSGAHGLLWS